MRFMPTNFTRPKKSESESEAPSSSLGTSAAQTSGQFDDLLRAARTDAARLRDRSAGRGRGRGRGPEKALTTFGGGADTLAGTSRPAARGGSWAGGRGRGGGSGHGGRVGAKAEGKVKEEGGGEGGGGAMEVDGAEEGGAAGGQPRRLVEDPFNQDQYYPTALPFREPGSVWEEDDDGGVPPSAAEQSAAEQQVAHASMLEDLAFLKDVEQNDGRLMLLQLPSVLPVPAPGAGVGPDAGGGPRPAGLRDLPPAHVGRLLVFESGAVKLRMGGVLLDVNPGTAVESRQDVAMINVQSKHFAMLGAVQQRLVVSPNVESLLAADAPLPSWERAPGCQLPAAPAGAARRGGDAPAAAGGGDESSSSETSSSSTSSSSSSEDEAEAMEVDDGAPAKSKPRSRGNDKGKGKAAAGDAANGIAHVKEEEGEEEVVSPRAQPPGSSPRRRSGAASPRGGGGGSRPTSPRSGRGGGVRSPRGKKAGPS
eukprot:scaffold15.g4218.t1